MDFGTWLLASYHTDRVDHLREEVQHDVDSGELFVPFSVEDLRARMHEMHAIPAALETLDEAELRYYMARNERG